jgi:hypothetical protein
MRRKNERAKLVSIVQAYGESLKGRALKLSQLPHLLLNRSMSSFFGNLTIHILAMRWLRFLRLDRL